MTGISPPPRPSQPRESVPVTCTGCGKATTVPFTPTPGRPVYCRECFASRGGGQPSGAGPRSAPRPSGGGYRGGDDAPRPRQARKRMLSQGRKAHFVYDALDVLGRRGSLAEEHRRSFVETLFTRGARQSTQAAAEYLLEKREDKTITPEEAQDIERLLERYSFWR